MADFNHCSSNHPEHDIYAGPYPFSEPESAAMAQFLLDHKSQFLFYFSLHAYAQYWLVPWAYKNDLPRDFVEMVSMEKMKILRQKLGYSFSLFVVFAIIGILSV